MKYAIASACMVLILGAMAPAIADSALVQSKGFASRLELQADSEAPQTQPQPKHYEGIIGGHRLQPSEHELSTPDVPTKDAKIVDKLYRKLIREEGEAYPELFHQPPNAPGAVPPASPKDHH